MACCVVCNLQTVLLTIFRIELKHFCLMLTRNSSYATCVNVGYICDIIVINSSSIVYEMPELIVVFLWCRYEGTVIN